MNNNEVNSNEEINEESCDNQEIQQEEHKQDNSQQVKVEEENNEVKRLTELLEKEKQEKQQYYEQYLRAMAEMENLRKRTQREKNEYKKFATLPLIKRLLPVIDDVERALSSSAQNQDYQVLSKGVEMINKSLHEVIKEEGVEVIKAVGSQFDPEYHEPLTMEESEEHPENTVLEEFQKGYQMHGRVIRAALVKVSK